MTTPKQSPMDLALAQERAEAEERLARHEAAAETERALIWTLQRIAAAHGNAAAQPEPAKPRAKSGEVEEAVMELFTNRAIIPALPETIAKLTGHNIGSVRQALSRLFKSGRIVRDGECYRAAPQLQDERAAE